MAVMMQSIGLLYILDTDHTQHAQWSQRNRANKGTIITRPLTLTSLQKSHRR